MASVRVQVVVLVAAATAASGCVVSLDSQGHTAREERRFEVSGVPDVHLTTFDGSVQIRSWDRDEVLVEIEKRGPTEDALKTIQVVVDQNGDRIQVEVRRPSGGDSFLGIGVHASRSARLIATVPRKANVVARSGDGSIRIEGVAGRCELRSGDGSVGGRELRGEIVVNTGDGSVGLQDVEGTVDLTTGDGGVSVSGVLSRVQVETHDGSVTVRADPGSAMADDWSIETSDGGISVYLPEDFSADVDAQTSDGRVTSDLEVTMTVTGRIERGTLKGRIGEGGQSLRVRSGDGTIRLRVS